MNTRKTGIIYCDRCDAPIINDKVMHKGSFNFHHVCPLKPIPSSLREQLHRLIIENQSEDGSIDRSDQSAMSDAILEIVAPYIEVAEIVARQNEIALSCIARVGGLTPEQQVFFEKRLEALQAQKAVLEEK